VKTVNTAFSQFHTDLMHLRTDNKGDAGKAIVENADKVLKDLRQNAVKAIHATNTCAEKATDDEDANEQDNDDNDNDENDDDQGDNDNHKSSSKAEGNFVVVLFSNLQSLFGNHTVTVNTTTASASPSTTLTGGDPKSIADEAVAAMKLAFDDAKSQLDALPTPSPRAKASKSPQPLRTDKRGDSHGHGHNDDD